MVALIGQILHAVQVRWFQKLIVNRSSIHSLAYLFVFSRMSVCLSVRLLLCLDIFMKLVVSLLFVCLYFAIVCLFLFIYSC